MTGDTPDDLQTERPVAAGPDDDAPTSLGRRAFIGVVGLGLTSLAWGGAFSDLLSKSTKVLPEGVRKAVPFGQGWRIYWVNKPFPVFRAASWRLKVDGLVEEPLDLGWEEFLALPQRDQVSDFHCVTGWSVDDVRWHGVGLADILARVKPLPEAKGLEFISYEEPYIDTLTLEQASMPDIMLAHRMGGEPLPQEHGAPVRVVIPKMYGYKGVKWLAHIRVVDTLEPGYWEVRGYDTDAWVDDSNGL
ncbi:MAG: molybdopterin-dependent oxidoreductase [Solirubrobacteraceae bacterium]|nr:molybdopterin-dependent oxidoreductase [Solirubrobacteraceae bacterium]